MPVHTLWGGCARARVPVTHSIGLIAIADAEKEVAQVVKEGIKTTERGKPFLLEVVAKEGYEFSKYEYE